MSRVYIRKPDNMDSGVYWAKVIDYARETIERPKYLALFANHSRVITESLALIHSFVFHATAIASDAPHSALANGSDEACVEQLQHDFCSMRYLYSETEVATTVVLLTDSNRLPICLYGVAVEKELECDKNGP